MKAGELLAVLQSSISPNRSKARCVHAMKTQKPPTATYTTASHTQKNQAYTVSPVHSPRAEAKAEVQEVELAVAVSVDGVTDGDGNGDVNIDTHIDVASEATSRNSSSSTRNKSSSSGHENIIPCRNSGRYSPTDNAGSLQTAERSLSSRADHEPETGTITCAPASEADIQLQFSDV